MSNARTRRPGEMAFAALIVLFSLFAAWQAWRISGFSSPSSPGMFPMIATATMVVSGFLILADTARRKPETGRNLFEAFIAEVTPLKLIVFGAMIVAYMLALQPVGFIGSSFVFLFASMAWLYRGHILMSLAVSAVSLALIYFIFRHVFSVVLPAGRLF